MHALDESHKISNTMCDSADNADSNTHNTSICESLAELRERLSCTSGMQLWGGEVWGYGGCESLSELRS